jgi:hypothetical protein
MAGRPKKGGRTALVKSFSISPEVFDFLSSNGGNNISSFLNAFISSHMAETREMTAIRIKHLSEEIAQTESTLIHMKALRDTLQSEYNLYKEPDDLKGKARQIVLEQFHRIAGKDGLRGEAMFRGWLTGPANVHHIKEAGFANEGEAITWCRGQKA